MEHIHSFKRVSFRIDNNLKDVKLRSRHLGQFVSLLKSPNFDAANIKWRILSGLS